ncbi:hypothetical protein H6G33_08140 [Calothrix sp. FACHB-1219]|uniref:hypothetical protein n=1 Tax=unclassified Calothrix TaxID=2619626 RepID=UPI001687A1D3|nr:MULTISPECIES: hypothetical protein [unclassified Calothrix]MBD2201963.1 hypothetical protein [Calothrix sp. FACHB-168]MBD2216999.1 hypothetical protein [Calothrix sp. FACHB-1219]
MNYSLYRFNLAAQRFSNIFCRKLLNLRNGNTIFIFILNSIGLNTSGNLIQFWDVTAAGLDATNSIDGFAVG